MQRGASPTPRFWGPPQNVKIDLMATTGAARKALTFFDTTIGKKAVLAVSGVILFGFVIVHMLGNLQVFLGPEVFNGYAETLKANPAVLWGARSVLLMAAVLHVITVVQLYTRSLAARPQGYRQRKNIATSYAAATMKYSGPALLLYIIFHLAHFTYPCVAMGDYEHSTTDVYANFVSAFTIPWVAAIYIVANLLLGMHLYHGGFSLLQSLGLNHPKYNAKVKGAARAFAFLVTAGNVAMPLAVLLGFVGEV